MRTRWAMAPLQMSGGTTCARDHGVSAPRNVLPSEGDFEDVVFDDPDSEDESGDPQDRERSDEAGESEEEG